MDPATSIEFERLTERLAISGLTSSAPEAHGILCGLICGGGSGAQEAWVGELLAGRDSNDLSAREFRWSLGPLAERTLEEIEGPGLGFTPLLPAEERPLAERALAVYDWSRGFLYGLGLGGIDPAGLSAQAREAFDGFAAITGIDLDALDESEDNDGALMELTEFIPVGAMLIYEEMGRGEGSG